MLLIACALLVSAAQLPPTVPPRRDAIARGTPTTPAATGIIRGRVTDRESGEPLARVMVMLVPKSFEEEPRPARSAGTTLEPRMTLTGPDGRFEYKRVPAGAYIVSFDPSELRGSHLRQYFGEVDPANDLSGSRPPPLVLAEGEVRGDVTGALSRSLAIEGRVLDEFGDPIANVDVSAHPWDGPADVYLGRPRATDDRGAFRLFGLKPGQYRVCAKPEPHFRITEDDVRDRLLPTCYPSARVEADSAPVALASADVGGIDIRVQRTRAYKITGVAIDAAGAPVERAEISLVTVEKNGFSAGSIETRPGGHFLAQAVPPGDYAIQVEIGSRYNPEDKRERELGYVPVRVENGDVDGVVVTTTKLARITGRMIFEEGAPEGRGEPIRVSARTSAIASGVMHFGPWPSAEVKEDFTFELSGLFGRQIIMVTGQPREWIVSEVKYRGVDITDAPVELKTNTDPAALEIIMTRRGAIISGRVTDEAGKGTEMGYVVLISANPARRRTGTGIVNTAKPKADGTFTLAPVRAGEYVILAVSGEQMMHLTMPMADEETLERAVHSGERLVLVESERRLIDLRLLKK